MTPSLRAAAAACLLASCRAETLMKYVLVPGPTPTARPCFQLGRSIALGLIAERDRAPDESPRLRHEIHLRQTHACGNDVNCITAALWWNAWPRDASCDADWPERLADVVQRLSKASAGYEAFGDIASYYQDRRTSSRVRSSRSTSAWSCPREHWFCGAERRSSATRKHKKSL